MSKQGNNRLAFCIVGENNMDNTKKTPIPKELLYAMFEKSSCADTEDSIKQEMATRYAKHEDAAFYRGRIEARRETMDILEKAINAIFSQKE